MSGRLWVTFESQQFAWLSVCGWKWKRGPYLMSSCSWDLFLTPETTDRLKCFLCFFGLFYHQPLYLVWLSFFQSFSLSLSFHNGNWGAAVNVGGLKTEKRKKKKKTRWMRLFVLPRWCGAQARRWRADTVLNPLNASWGDAEEAPHQALRQPRRWESFDPTREESESGDGRLETPLAAEVEVIIASGRRGRGRSFGERRSLWDHCVLFWRIRKHRHLCNASIHLPILSHCCRAEGLEAVLEAEIGDKSHELPSRTFQKGFESPDQGCRFETHVGRNTGLKLRTTPVLVRTLELSYAAIYFCSFMSLTLKKDLCPP